MKSRQAKFARPTGVRPHSKTRMNQPKAHAMTPSRHPTKTSTLNESKFRELLLYITRCCEREDTLGEVKLNKILFYCEFACFGQTGRSITGQTFHRQPLGPCSKALRPVREKMIRDQECAISEVNTYGNTQKRTVPLRDPDLSKFSSVEISIVDKVLRQWSGVYSAAISESSHQEYCWLAAHDGEEIPYETVFFSRRPLTPAEVAYGRSLQPV